MSKVVLASDIQCDSIVDGPGLRAVIWFQGCSHNCFKCHNPGTHPFNSGITYDIDEVKEMIDNLDNQDGITFSGGDPLFQPEAFIALSKYAKEKGYNTWCYTGFTYEEVLKMNKELLSYLDVLIDGKFEHDKHSLELKYKGSSNQRVIDVQKSLEQSKVVLYCE